jgi:hypothetical protein
MEDSERYLDEEVWDINPLLSPEPQGGYGPEKYNALMQAASIPMPELHRFQSHTPESQIGKIPH